MSLLTALIVKNSYILAGIYYVFLKNVLYQTWKAFHTKFGPQCKDRESSYQVRGTLALFCKSVDLILGWDCVKGFRISNKLNFKGFGAS